MSIVFTVEDGVQKYLNDFFKHVIYSAMQDVIKKIETVAEVNPSELGAVSVRIKLIEEKGVKK